MTKYKVCVQKHLVLLFEWLIPFFLSQTVTKYSPCQEWNWVFKQGERHFSPSSPLSLVCGRMWSVTSPPLHPPFDPATHNCVRKAKGIWATHTFYLPTVFPVKLVTLSFMILVKVHMLIVYAPKNLFLCKLCLIEQDFFCIGVSHSVYWSFCPHFQKSNFQTF